MLRDTLNSLARQIYPRDCYEVIVVDDGSTDGTDEVVKEEYPFTLRYFWQSNQGDAAARNLGAQQSKADILVFVDDDILVEPGYLAHLIHAHDTRGNKIVVGTWNFWPADVTPLSRAIYPSLDLDHSNSITNLPFRDVYSNNMSIWRDDFFKIGMMKGLFFSGSSMWCDLEFSYRAYRQGFEFLRSNKAICWHRDYAVRFLSDYKKRMETASYRAVVLFQLYPELLSELPMFYDKTPIDWRKDPSSLIIRKLSRSITSSRLALWSMEQIVNVLEKSNPESTVLPSLYRGIIGGYIFHGYREGLRKFEPTGALN
jgi:glycosyltransferase involved in cell wall biosynthesis